MKAKSKNVYVTSLLLLKRIKMYLKPLIRSYSFSIITLILIIWYISEDNSLPEYTPLIILGFYGLVSHFFDRCPKCNHLIGLNKYGLTTLLPDKKCQKCGQDLMKYEIETDEEIEIRKKKPRR